MTKRTCGTWVLFLLCGTVVCVTEALALPPAYPSATPSAVEPGIRQERYIDPIDIGRLIRFVPANLRAGAKRDFASWNTRLQNSPRTFAKKYATSETYKAREKASLQAFQERKVLAYDKLALFERYRIGRFFFAPGAKTLTARVTYLDAIFNQMERRKDSSVSLSSLLPHTSSYLATLRVGSSNLLKQVSDSLIECAHAEENCPPAGSPKTCEDSAPICNPFSSSDAPYKPADASASVNQVDLEAISLGCAHAKDSDTASRGATALLSVYEIAETYYVCADSSKNVTKSPSRELLAKIYVDGVSCNDDSTAIRNFGAYLFESGIEDGPIPDGCVGINKVAKPYRSFDIQNGSYVTLNAAPCWEKHWECRYKANPVDVVTDVDLMKDPTAPTCPS